MTQRTESLHAASTSGQRGACCFRFSCSRSKWLSRSHCSSLELGPVSVPAPQLYLGFAPGAGAQPPPVHSGLLPAVPSPCHTVGTKASSYCLLVGCKLSRIFVSWLKKGKLKALRDTNNVIICIILMPEVMKTPNAFTSQLVDMSSVFLFLRILTSVPSRWEYLVTAALAVSSRLHV